jgi:hypothetical protein
LEKKRSLYCRNDFHSYNGNGFRLYGVPFNTEIVMDNLIDTLNEIIATGDNCNLPYISILGRKAKKEAVEQIIKSNRNAQQRPA